MKSLYTILMFVLLSGCAGTIPQNYSAAEIAAEKMAFLTTIKAESKKEDFKTGIFSVINSENELIAERGIISDPFTEMYLPEGRYIVALECSNGAGSAIPRMLVTLEKSKKYLLSCEVAETTKAWLTGVDLIASLKGKIQEIETQHNKNKN